MAGTRKRNSASLKGKVTLEAAKQTPEACAGRHVREAIGEERKYEDIYIKDYPAVPELESGLTVYFRLYDEDRPH
jgi:hypothetical protein